jgi:dTDP-4-dehydrorhamnose reductase
MPMRATKILLTGGSGYLGARLCEALRDRWQVTATFARGPDRVPAGVVSRLLDVRDQGAVHRMLASERPDVVIHAAAMASLQRCEEAPDVAQDCNARGTANVAAASRAVGASLVYVSTDLVFGGTRGWYEHDDEPDPCCVYGRSKLLGEKAVMNSSDDWCILRASLLYGWTRNGRRCFLEEMLLSLRSGRAVSLFLDEFRTPTLVEDFCRAVELSIERGIRGVYHVAGPERISRHAFGLLAAEVFKLPVELIAATKSGEVAPERPADCSMVASRTLLESGWRAATPLDALTAMAATEP